MKAIPAPSGAIKIDPAATKAQAGWENVVRAFIVALVKFQGFKPSDGTKEEKLKAALAAEKRSAKRAGDKVLDTLCSGGFVSNVSVADPPILPAMRESYFMGAFPGDPLAGFWQSPEIKGAPRCKLPIHRWRGTFGPKPAKPPAAEKKPREVITLAYTVEDVSYESPPWRLFRTPFKGADGRLDCLSSPEVRKNIQEQNANPERTVTERKATLNVAEDADPVDIAVSLLDRAPVVWCNRGCFVTFFVDYSDRGVQYRVAVRRKWYESEAKATEDAQTGETTWTATGLAKKAVDKAIAEGINLGQWKEGQVVPLGCKVMAETEKDADGKDRPVWKKTGVTLGRGQAGHWSRLLVQNVTAVLVEPFLTAEDVKRFGKPVKRDAYVRPVPVKTRNQPGYTAKR